MCQQTANDSRPRPEEVVGNAKVNKLGTHIHTHTKLQTENMADGKVLLKGWVLWQKQTSLLKRT